MSNLNIEFKKIFPFIIEAYVEVYGKKYENIITTKINNVEIINYKKVEDLENYIAFLKNMNFYEQSLLFFKEINFNMEEFENINIDEDDEFDKVMSYAKAILNFDNNLKLEPTKLKDRLLLLNKLGNYNEKTLKEKDFESFAQTFEYKKLSNYIMHLNLYFRMFLKANKIPWYIKIEEDIREYEQYIKFENRRKFEALNTHLSSLNLDLNNKKVLETFNIYKDLIFNASPTEISKELRHKDYNTAKYIIEKYWKFIKDYYNNDQEISDTINKLNNQDSIFYLKEKIIENVENNEICVSNISDSKCVTLVFYFIRTGNFGEAAAILLHEMGHVIDNNFNGCGFDINGSKLKIFNEIITDIFALEACSILESKNIYLLEPKEITRKEKLTRNTTRETQNLITPLVNKYRKEVIESKINSDSNYLTNVIGIRNFNELVNIIYEIENINRNLFINKYISNEEKNKLENEKNKYINAYNNICIEIDKYSNKKIIKNISNGFTKLNQNLKKKLLL